MVGARHRGFTLIELLVVIAIMALLMGILMPVMSRARAQSRLATCLANLRGQGAALALYTTQYSGRLPPKFYWKTGGGATEGLLINGFLAKFLGQPFQPVSSGFPVPEGIFRCPEVSPGDESQMWTHYGYLHHAPNTWLFNDVSVNEDTHTTSVSAEAYNGWQQAYGTSSWRVVERVRQASVVIALMDNVNFDVPAHNHREARLSVGLSCEVAYDPHNAACGDNLGSHQSIGRRPAVFVDGHAENLPIGPDYWLDEHLIYPAPSGDGVTLWRREVQHFHWYIDSVGLAGD